MDAPSKSLYLLRFKLRGKIRFRCGPDRSTVVEIVRGGAGDVEPEI